MIPLVKQRDWGTQFPRKTWVGLCFCGFAAKTQTNPPPRGGAAKKSATPANTCRCWRDVACYVSPTTASEMITISFSLHMNMYRDQEALL